MKWYHNEILMVIDNISLYIFNNIFNFKVALFTKLIMWTMPAVNYVNLLQFCDLKNYKTQDFLTILVANDFI